MKKRTNRLLALVLAGCMTLTSVYLPGFTKEATAAGKDFTLFNGTEVGCLYLDSDTNGKTEYSQVQRAGEDLKNDIKEVTGKTPEVVATESALAQKKGKSTQVVIAGTIGHSDLIDKLINEGKLDTSKVANEWEAYSLQLVDNPCAGVEKALVIVGSDKRGTIYGIYTLSEKIGVSPWYWWGDVGIDKKSELSFTKSEIEQTDKPDVKYRGIFLNDEENFQEWSKRFENDTDSPGSPNAKTYEKVFELMLRLKSNILWPAMHQQSTAFNGEINPETGISFNAEAADRYGIVMGASHCEMLLRNNETEWEPWCEKNQYKYHIEKVNNNWKDGYDYTVNKEAMNAYWEERVASNYKFDNVYTIGLRAVHDSAINCRDLADKSYAGKATVVKQAVEAQVAILEKYEKKYEEETGEKKKFAKLFCPYKEAAEYFKYDLSLPDDTIIVWADDNHGYVRQQCTQEELDKYVGAGVYYHVSYYDINREQSYLWVASTPLSMIYEEMKKSYDAGSDDCWILNVGDLKPAEIPTEFFLNMGWNVNEYNDTNIDTFIEKIASRDWGFNKTQCKELYDILTEYYQINIAKRPEYHLAGMGSEYSMINYGDEAQKQVNKMVALCDRSEKLLQSLPAAKQDSYWEMVQYMLRAARYSFEKGVYQQKNQLYYEQGRFASVNAYAEASLSAYYQIMEDLDTYNEKLAGGKWKNIINPYSTKQNLPTIKGAPAPLTYVSPSDARRGVGAVCEGQKTGSEDVTLMFDSLTDDERFIDVFNKDSKDTNFTMVLPNGIILKDNKGTVLKGTDLKDGTYMYSGVVKTDTRFLVSGNWTKLSNGETNGEIVVMDNAGTSKAFPVSLNKANVTPSRETTKGYYETNGEVSIEAEHFSNSVKVGNQEWKVVNNLGRCGSSLKVFPDTITSTNRIDSNFETDAPYVEYNIYFNKTGEYGGKFYRLPTLNEGNGNRTCRTAIQFDNGAIDLLRGNSSVGDGSGKDVWKDSVRNQIEEMDIPIAINVKTPGWHTLRVYKSDAGIVFDKITLYATSQGLKQSHLGAPESYQTVTTYRKDTPALAMDVSEDSISYPAGSTKTSFLYDFTNTISNAAAGYYGVDDMISMSAARHYSWDGATFKNVSSDLRDGLAKTARRDQGFVSGNKPAAITFAVPKEGKYLLSAVIGDRLSGGVDVEGMSITANGTKAVDAINVASGQSKEFAFYATAGKDKKLTIGFDGKPWAIAALEIGLVGTPNDNGGKGIFYTKDGVAAIEAEAALENSDIAWTTKSQDDRDAAWVEGYGECHSAMVSGPNSNFSYSATNANDNKGPKLNYMVDFREKGTYAVWIYTKSQSADDDSLLVSLDDGEGKVINDVKDTEGKFVWKKVTSFDIAATGEKKVSVWMREDGISVDRIVLTKNGDTPIGLGAMSLRVVDNKALQQTVAAVEKTDTSKCTTDSRNAFAKALATAKAILASDTATQYEINNAITALENAKKALKVATIPPKTPANGTYVKNGKTYLYKNNKQVTGTKVATVAGNTYALKKSVVVTGKTQLVTIGKKTYIVNKKGIVQKTKKGYKVISVKGKKYITTKTGVILKNKKKVKVGKKKYNVDKKGIAKAIK
ncbi:MAG: glycosyl hydrolase 115 family protein [Lachnospiraceae bacterium]|nr:glycosyl hydrolase 115 family protein [Lachnospiraceae bacterium]